MDSSLLTTNSVLLFILIVTRISGMLIAAPFFNQAAIPQQVKVWFAVMLSFIMFPVYATKAPLPASDMWAFLLVAGEELIIGLLIGFTCSLFFGAIDLASHFVTTQMGLGSAMMLDPISNAQAPVMGQVYSILAMTLFMSLNLHHTLIFAVAKSFEFIPLATHITNFNVIIGRMNMMASELFSVGLMLILPVLGCMLVLDIALAFMSKVMPQMNVFMVSLPLKVFVALVLIIVTLPFTLDAMTKSFDGLSRHLMVLYHP